jgi:hypothetical protein
MSIAWAVTLAALLAGSAAQAGMIPVSVGVTPDGDKFRWTYGVVVTTDVNVNAGDSFTIYDIGGFNAGTVVAPDGWSISQATTTPPLPGVHPNDNPNLMDLTFTYAGSTPIQGQSGLGNFSVISDFSEGTSSEFTSRVHRQVDGRIETTITSTDSPGVPDPVIPDPPPTGPPLSNTPEPASLALLALALPAAGVFGLRRRKPAAA